MTIFDNSQIHFNLDPNQVFFIFPRLIEIVIICESVHNHNRVQQNVMYVKREMAVILQRNKLTKIQVCPHLFLLLWRRGGARKIDCLPTLLKLLHAMGKYFVLNMKIVCIETYKKREKKDCPYILRIIVGGKKCRPPRKSNDWPIFPHQLVPWHWFVEWSISSIWCTYQNEPNLCVWALHCWKESGYWESFFQYKCIKFHNSSLCPILSVHR